MKHFHTAPDDLPSDFHERSAYMRLYRSHQEGETCWHRENFGNEIYLLLERGHAVDVGNGYHLTQTGIAHWEGHVRAWLGRPLSAEGINRSAQALANLQDGQWHAESEAMVGMAPATWNSFVRPQLEQQKLIERGRHGRERLVRLTEAGIRALAAPLTREKAG